MVTTHFHRHGLLLLQAGKRALWGKSEADVKVGRIRNLIPLVCDGVGLSPSKWSDALGLKDLSQLVWKKVGGGGQYRKC